MKAEPNPAAQARKLTVERANLAYMLAHPETLPEFLATLAPRDFTPPLNRNIYEAIVQAYSEAAPLDGGFVVAVRVRLQTLCPEISPEKIGVELGKLVDL